MSNKTSKINLQKITERQKLIISKGLLDYLYIKKYWKTYSEDFQKVYFDFYLKGAAISNKKDIYFEIFKKINKDVSMEQLLNILLKKMGKVHLSISSKMLHTFNNNLPIYDSVVSGYLKSNYDLSIKSASQKKDRMKNALQNWESLNEWYTSLKYEADRNEIIEWFDLNYPNESKISNVKKIDFVIWACANRKKVNGV